MPKFLKYPSFLLGKKMLGFRHHGQDLIEFAKLLVPKSLKKKIIYI
jgi:hypothetical protein